VVAAYREFTAGALGTLVGHDQKPLAAGLLVVAAGIYQLTPLKRKCLGGCRPQEGAGLPSAAVPPPAISSALSGGLRYAVACLGTSAGLMVALAALGLMDLTWMLVIATLVFIERVPRLGPHFVVPVAIAVLGLGALVLLSPTQLTGVISAT
jgi:predicted metal-binding membrane protein